MSGIPTDARAALTDTTVIVPVRIDSPDRLRNLGIALCWINRCCKGQRTIVLEHAEADEAGSTAREHGAEHVFLRSEGCFHKTRVFNLGIALADRRFVLLYDCDVLVPVRALDEALGVLRRGEADYVYPYNGVMLEVACPEPAPESILDAAFLSAEGAHHGDAREAAPAGTTVLNGTVEEPSTGGAVACERRRLLLDGGFNENIMSYGCEDTELETRVTKLGARVQRVPGYNCFHLRHRRGADSHYNRLHAANFAEWKKVEAMPAGDLSRYVANGFRSLVVDGTRPLVVEDTPARFAVSLAPPDRRVPVDTAFVLVLEPGVALPSALVAAFFDGIESRYSDYEIHVLEGGGPRHRVVTHRDHVVYAPFSDETAMDLLRRVVDETDRARVCVCNVFMDVRREHLAAAIESVCTGSRRAIALALADLAPGADARGGRLLSMLRSRVTEAWPAFVFDRTALAEWLAEHGAENVDRSWSEIVRAASAARDEPSA